LFAAEILRHRIRRNHRTPSPQSRETHLQWSRPSQ